MLILAYFITKKVRRTATFLKTFEKIQENCNKTCKFSHIYAKKRAKLQLFWKKFYGNPQKIVLIHANSFIFHHKKARITATFLKKLFQKTAKNCEKKHANYLLFHKDKARITVIFLRNFEKNPGKIARKKILILLYFITKKCMKLQLFKQNLTEIYEKLRAKTCYFLNILSHKCAKNSNFFDKVFTKICG